MPKLLWVFAVANTAEQRGPLSHNEPGATSRALRQLGETASSLPTIARILEAGRLPPL